MPAGPFAGHELPGRGAPFGFGMRFYVLMLAPAHVVIHRCATGRAFVAGVVAIRLHRDAELTT